jgi:hypothetical protein
MKVFSVPIDCFFLFLIIFCRYSLPVTVIALVVDHLVVVLTRLVGVISPLKSDATVSASGKSDTN